MIASRLTQIQGHAHVAGYSLVELLVVLAVMGVLASLVMPLAELDQRRERERELRRALWQVREAIDDYHRVVVPLALPGASTYPPNLKVLVDGLADGRVPGGVRYLLRKLPRDPFADPTLPAEATWNLRSYASPPDKPQAGSDVYDISSSSTALALDGTALRDW